MPSLSGAGAALGLRHRLEVEGEHKGKMHLDASTRRTPVQPVMLRHRLRLAHLQVAGDEKQDARPALRQQRQICGSCSPMRRATARMVSSSGPISAAMASIACCVNLFSGACLMQGGCNVNDGDGAMKSRVLTEQFITKAARTRQRCRLGAVTRPGAGRGGIRPTEGARADATADRGIAEAFPHSSPIGTPRTDRRAGAGCRCDPYCPDLARLF
jgi:hypothetical protein